MYHRICLDSTARHKNAGRGVCHTTLGIVQHRPGIHVVVWSASWHLNCITLVIVCVVICQACVEFTQQQQIPKAQCENHFAPYLYCCKNYSSYLLWVCAVCRSDTVCVCCCIALSCIVMISLKPLACNSLNTTTCGMPFRYVRSILIEFFFVIIAAMIVTHKTHAIHENPHGQQTRWSYRHTPTQSHDCRRGKCTIFCSLVNCSVVNSIQGKRNALPEDAMDMDREPIFMWNCAPCSLEHIAKVVVVLVVVVARRMCAIHTRGKVHKS